MKHHLFSLALAALAAGLFAGCSDPADKVHKASTSDPKKSDSGASTAGKEYVVRDGDLMHFRFAV